LKGGTLPTGKEGENIYGEPGEEGGGGERGGGEGPGYRSETEKKFHLLKGRKERGKKRETSQGGGGEFSL